MHTLSPNVNWAAIQISAIARIPILRFALVTAISPNIFPVGGREKKH